MLTVIVGKTRLITLRHTPLITRGATETITFETRVVRLLIRHLEFLFQHSITEILQTVRHKIKIM